MTDVAIAILDAHRLRFRARPQCAFPADAVTVMARIATVTEADFPSDERAVGALLQAEHEQGRIAFEDLVSLNVFLSSETLDPALVFVPTHSGITAQRLARFRLPMWIVAFSPDEQTCQNRTTWGVWTVHTTETPASWVDYVRAWSRDFAVNGRWRSSPKAQAPSAPPSAPTS
ncbi:MAG: pyruvate kinase alpha/beta domain-containing protein [Caldilineaceae bacterium]